MENQNKNSELYVLIVILCILVLGLGGYIVYDKVINPQNTQKSKNDYNIEDNSIQGNENSSSIVYKQYNIGDEIMFNNEKWNVIKNSTEKDDYVVVLKATDIEELNGKPFYNCPAEDDNGINCSMKLTNDYQKSVAKEYFDTNYINILGKGNLKEINGYYVRLITIEELEALGCDLKTNSCSNAPSWLTTDAAGIVSWTMSSSKTGSDMQYSFGFDNYTGVNGIRDNGVGSTLDVRPVINLLKSSIK